MVVWCVKECESVHLFQRFRAVFYRLPRLVRGWPASQVRAGFSPVNACFCVNTAGGLIDDRLHSAILRSLEQTHCARMRFYMSD